MAKARMNEDARDMEIDVPVAVITEVAEIIEEAQIEAQLTGNAEEADAVRISVQYNPEHRGDIMEILELIKDYEDEQNDNDEEEEEDDDE